MERHHMTMAASVHARTDEDTVGSVATHVRAAINNTIERPDQVSAQTSFVEPDIGLRMHTLVLTGSLDRSSVHSLEAEIERLCEEGVTGITLDLRQLTDIDAFGVAVIAFRCGLCRRRGYDFALIRIHQLIHDTQPGHGVLGIKRRRAIRGTDTCRGEFFR